MSTRIATITAEVQIPKDQDYDEAVGEALGEVEGGIQHTGFTYRLSVRDAPSAPEGNDVDREYEARTLLCRCGISLELGREFTLEQVEALAEVVKGWED